MISNSITADIQKISCLNNRHLKCLPKLHRLALINLCVGFCLACLSGCGQSGEATYQVQGHLYFKEQPVKHGFVTFVSKKGRPVRVGTDTSGNYAASLPAGHYRIAVISMSDAEVEEATSAVDAPDRVAAMLKSSGKKNGNDSRSVFSTRHVWPYL